MSNDDYDYLSSFARTLTGDATLRGLVDDAYVDFPLTDTSKTRDAMKGTHKTMLSVSMPYSKMRGSWGSATSRIQETKGIVQIDVCSQQGDNAAYTRRVGTRIADLLFLWVDITLDSNRYAIYCDWIEKGPVDYDNELKCWHEVMLVNVQYFRVAPA